MVRPPLLHRLLALVALIGSTASAADIRVLLIGNSQITSNDLEVLLQTMAAGASPRLAVTSAAINGADLAGCYAQGTGPGSPRSWIAGSTWDWVVLQDWYGQADVAGFEATVRKFQTDVRASPGGASTRILLFATASISSGYPAGFTTIRSLHAQAATDLSLPWADAGGSWLRYWGPTPTEAQRLALYGPDQQHPGIIGSTIYAASLYAGITGRSPVGLPDPTAGVVPAATLAAAQQAAWDVYREAHPDQTGGGTSSPSGGDSATRTGCLAGGSAVLALLGLRRWRRTAGRQRS